MAKANTEYNSKPSERTSPSSGQRGRKYKSLDEAFNGTMVQDEQDAKRLGNDMKVMKTNHQLQEDGLVPDPIQE
ncbi:MAG TPA: hypothetical protein VMS09_12375 [Paenibacillus sp.]|uniref:hypothetical protein n=1 Tax=Paenibacillus sp. TaxID=58172 RepID=UPI0028D11354|nr:hypothetical protein [Paenibacillus sp.]HUC92801.1 hypothetical protein [Paenibacillus sp.]